MSSELGCHAAENRRGTGRTKPIIVGGDDGIRSPAGRGRESDAIAGWTAQAKAEARMTVSLLEQTCTPCRGGIPPLAIAEARLFLEQAPKWTLPDTAADLQRTFWFSNFRQSLDFVRDVGELAEAEG